MKFGFACLECGQPLSQESVVFDLLNPIEDQGTDKFRLFIKEAQLKSLCKSNLKNNKKNGSYYKLKLRWRTFLKYLSNADNMNCPELLQLSFKEAQEILKYKPQFQPYNDQPMIFRRLCNYLNMDSYNLYRELKRIVDFFAEDGKFLSREIRPDIQNGLLVGLELRDGKTGESLGYASRSCKKCGAAVFKEAGSAPHHTVVLIGPKECPNTQERVLTEMGAFLKNYKGVSKGVWTTKLITELRETAHTITTKITIREAHCFLTLAVAPEEYCGENVQNICFFPEANAYILCDEKVAMQATNYPARYEKGLLQSLERLQRSRSVTTKSAAYAPVLLVYGTTENHKHFPTYPHDMIPPIFPKDRGKLNMDSAHVEFLAELKKRMGSFPKRGCFYTQLFYPFGDSEGFAERAVMWTLKATGCIPIELKNIIGETKWNNLKIPPEYTISGTEYITASPVQQLLSKTKEQKAQHDECLKAEMLARLHLFDNCSTNYIDILGKTRTQRRKSLHDSYKTTRRNRHVQ